MGAQGGAKALLAALELVAGDAGAVVVVLRALATVLHGQPDLLGGTPVEAEQDDQGAVVPPPSIVQLVQVLGAHAGDAAVQQAGALAVRRACTLHETNRQAFVNAGVLPRLLGAVAAFAAQPDTHGAATAALQTLRALTNDDDIRVPYGKAADHIKLIVSELQGLPTLVAALDAAQGAPALTAEIFKTAGQFAVRNEYCQDLVSLGALQRALDTLQPQREASPPLAQAACILVRSIAGVDDIKAAIGKASGIELLVDAVQRAIKHAGAVEQGCAALAALCLRSPDNAQAFVLADGPSVIVRCLHVHHDAPKLLRQACTVLRNVASRSPQLREAILGEGAEAALQAVMQKHKDCHDAAKAALRDLGCKVELRELWTGALKTADGAAIPELLPDPAAADNQ